MNEKISLGEFFRQKREEKNLTIKDVCEVTKLSKSIILAIENDNFEDLPGGFFNRGILRTYAKFLELDEGKIIKTYESLYEDGREKKEKILTINREFKINLLSKKVVLVFLVALFVLLLVWIFIPSDFSLANVENIKKITQVEKTGQNIEKKLVSKQNSIQKKSEKDKKIIISNSQKKNFAQKVKINRNEIILKLVFKGDCWTEIRNGNKLIVSSLFSAGNSFKTNGRSFNIKLGNPGVVDIFINGKIYKFEYKDGIPKTLIFNYKDFLR